MKNFKPLFLLLLACILSLPVTAQKKCRVMPTNLKGTYNGECVKGLAHGKGVAAGEDTYNGNFKKGYPHGLGTCYYADESFYSGEWKKGMRHGKGEYTIQINGRDTITAGRWKNDEYVGPIVVKPYRVTAVRSVDRYTIRKLGEEKRVLVKILQNGMTNTGISNFRIFGDRGIQVYLPEVYGYERIEEFPFNCQITYTTYNKLRTARHDVIFNFTINEPGDWEIILHN